MADSGGTTDENKVSAMHFGLPKFFFVCWAGKTVKGMAVAYPGYYGLGSILRWTGIGV